MTSKSCHNDLLLSNESAFYLSTQVARRDFETCRSHQV